LKGILMHPGLKLLALLFALVFWTMQSAPRREKLVERPAQAPLSLVGIPRDLVITTRPLPDSVSVRLRGRPSELAGVIRDMEATLDLGDVRVGEVQVPIRPQALNLPPQVEVVTIEPANLRITLEQRRQRIVPIRPYPVGSLPPAFTLGEITVTPSVCEISGPASLIVGVTETATERVILSGRTQSFQTTVGVVSDHPLVRVVSPLNVVVTVNIIPPPPEPSAEEAAAAATGTEDP
jgi:YbbR domain-containing protein